MSPAEYTVLEDYIIFTDKDHFCCFDNYALIYFLHEVDDSVKTHMQTFPEMISIILNVKYLLHNVHWVKNQV